MKYRSYWLSFLSQTWNAYSDHVSLLRYVEKLKVTRLFEGQSHSNSTILPKIVLALILAAPGSLCGTSMTSQPFLFVFPPLHILSPTKMWFVEEPDSFKPELLLSLVLQLSLWWKVLDLSGLNYLVYKWVGWISYSQVSLDQISHHEYRL